VPVNFTAAIEHDNRPFDQRTVHTSDGERRYDEQPFWTAQPAVAGLPALAAPAGRTLWGSRIRPPVLTWVFMRLARTH
jgi:amidase